MGSRLERDEALLQNFVASFQKFDDMLAMDPSDLVEWQLAVGDPDQYGWKRWRPAKIDTNSSFLEPIYAKLPARFPPLYERLVLSFRWAEVELDGYRLRANGPGPDLNGLWEEMSGDDFLFKTLIHAGYIPFGKGPDVDYDPVCFDLSFRKENSEFRIVKVDHEEILCNSRIKVVSELARTFEDLVLQTIERGAQIEKSPTGS
jgi:hypothetical protein